VPSLIRVFGAGPQSEKNAAAAQIVVDAAKQATGAVNEQDLLEKVQSKDPKIIAQVEAAVQSVWYEITINAEGIEGARTASKELSSSFWKQPAFWITVLLLPLPYLVVMSVLGFVGTTVYTTEIQIMVITAIISGVLSGITGYWLGTSFSSQRKTEIMNKGA
jgi:membrane protein DedA with SNARE-associated domain